MRQVGQLPRIIAWCTVNKTLNIRVSIYKIYQTRVSFVISYPYEVSLEIFALVVSYATYISG